jgi:hypothetical protein
VEETRLIELGRIAAASARLDAEVRMTAWCLVPVPFEVAAILTSGRNFSSVCDLARRLTEETLEDGPLRHSVVNLLQRARAAYSARGEFVHALWFAEGPQPDARILRQTLPGKKGARAWDLEHIPIEELRRLADELDCITVEFPSIHVALTEAVELGSD